MKQKLNIIWVCPRFQTGLCASVWNQGNAIKHRDKGKVPPGKEAGKRKPIVCEGKVKPKEFKC